MPALAQPTHAEVAAELGRACVRAMHLPPEVGFISGSTPPYLADRIVQALLEDGIQVHLNPQASPLPVLSGGMAVASVRVSRAERGLASREVTLAWDLRLAESSGAVLRVHTCAETARDTVPVRILDALLEPRWPVAPDAPLPPSRLSRWGQPLVLGAATVVSTLLLFSLRSR